MMLTGRPKSAQTAALIVPVSEESSTPRWLVSFWTDPATSDLSPGSTDCWMCPLSPVRITVTLTHFVQSFKPGTVTKGFDARLAN